MPTSISRRGPTRSTSQPSSGPSSPDSIRASENTPDMVVRFHPKSRVSGMIKLLNP